MKHTKILGTIIIVFALNVPLFAQPELLETFFDFEKYFRSSIFFEIFLFDHFFFENIFSKSNFSMMKKYFSSGFF